MQKGQISIDLLITLAAAIALIVTMSTIVWTYSETQERSTIQQQLQYTADKTASIITSAQALNDTNFVITEKIGKTYYTDENKNYRKTYPTMTIYNENTLRVSITYKGKTQDANAYFYAPTTTKIKINDGNVVISHEQ